MYTNAHKLQIDFAVDALRRANYREMLEGSRCCSLLVAEHAVELLQRWYGTYKWKHEKEESDPVSVGVFSASAASKDGSDGFVIVTPVFFKPDGSFQPVNQDSREEIAVILKKAAIEIAEFLDCLKRRFDPQLGVVPEELVLPDPNKVDSGLFVTSDRLTQRFEEFNLQGEEQASHTEENPPGEENAEKKPGHEEEEEQEQDPDAEVEADNEGHNENSV